MAQIQKSAKERIVSTSIDHFSQYGFDGTRMRDIVNEADVNLAAVNYYFGSKLGLYESLMTTYAKIVGKRRRKMLKDAKLVSDDGPIPLETIVKVVVCPFYEFAEQPDGEKLIRFLMRLPFEANSVANKLYKTHILPQVKIILTEMKLTMPDVDRAMHLRIYSLIVHSMSDTGSGGVFLLLKDRSDSMSTSERAEFIVTYCTAGIETLLNG